MASIFLNGTTDGRVIKTMGHSGPQAFGARGMMYRLALSNSWAAVPTFSASTPDGNRCMTGFSRNAQFWTAEECVFNRSGRSPDSAGLTELAKLEGRDNAYLDCVFRNGYELGLYCDSASWSWYCERNRIGHCVFDTLNGPIIEARDWLDDNQPGEEPVQGITRFTDLQFKNCLFRNVSMDAFASWIDDIIVMYLSAGVDWTQCIQMHGITIEDPTRTASTFYTNITRGVSPPGRQTLTYMLANYPANFSNITVQSGAIFPSPPDTDEDIESDEIATYYTPSVTANGVNLTTANGSGSAQTSLTVHDSRWFTDPRYGTSPQIHINGVGNRSYTAINKSTHVITLSAAATWSNGAAVNRAITSGSTPNRGAVR
jgi:hypothetical protein